MESEPPTFSPAWWCPGGHAQTIVGAICRPTQTLPLQRERWETPDGDFLDIDRLVGQPDTPRLVALHGLEGSSRSPDIQALMAAAQGLGWESIGLNFRSCSGEPNRLRRAYHAGETSDLAWLIQQLLREDGQRPIVCTGISLGGNVLLKYLGEQSAQAAAPLQAAVAISTPFDLNASVAYVEQGFSLLYIQRFVKSLKRKTLAKLEQYPDLVDRSALDSVQTLTDFDNLFTAPVHGFPDADTYWHVSSSIRFLPTIRRPTLLINAQDDPFYPADRLPYQQVAENPWLTGWFPAHGGHGGFVSGGWPWQPRFWIASSAIAFLQSQLAAPEISATASEVSLA